mmetsp:Transcript_15733/g.46000  ORF Transcript_15733/g.46000 Transcript_15733/m.46000 type:complete len:92 (+) Transcript_15733:62-337(+)
MALSTLEAISTGMVFATAAVPRPRRGTYLVGCDCNISDPGIPPPAVTSEIFTSRFFGPRPHLHPARLEPAVPAMALPRAGTSICIGGRANN